MKNTSHIEDKKVQQKQKIEKAHVSCRIGYSRYNITMSISAGVSLPFHSVCLRRLNGT